jgi:hypothetical protein
MVPTTTTTATSIYGLFAEAPTCGCRGRDSQCPQMVCEVRGRWFIRMEHCGFNLRANNSAGWGTEAEARRASVRIIEAGR